MVTLEDVQAAAQALEGVAVRSELSPSAALGELVRGQVFLKLENQQPTGAFKLRGAWTMINRLAEEDRAQGVITYSSGNHGQAVAFAAHRMGVRAVVVMPETAPPVKVDGVKRWGGEVEFAGRTSESRFQLAHELAERQSLTVIPPFDHRDIIAGQGTVGWEIYQDLPEVRQVVVPVGGGGLSAGVTTVLKGLDPDIEIVAVEPEGAAALGAALQAGQPIRLDRTDSVADGLLPLQIGKLNFEHLAGRVEAVTVSDDSIAAATWWLYSREDVLAEPSGAATTAALRSGAFSPRSPLVLIVSGGNVDPAFVRALGEQGKDD